jgi:hypothetical protein
MKRWLEELDGVVWRTKSAIWQANIFPTWLRDENPQNGLQGQWASDSNPSLYVKLPILMYC